MNEKRPYMVTFIGDGYIISAFLLTLSLFTDYVEPLPNYLRVPLSDMILNALIIIILLIACYGYLKLKRWGYWLIVSVELYYLLGWIISYKQVPIITIIGLIFILPTIKYFGEKTVKSHCSK
ncbi:hypothetical protein [Clostridium beijerinckii]|uniref:hypothetical protein n=1 Tax=Clostridium beijerinckii TaxID=1520 RepID=UPI00047A0743|nr:hypothetical protein [Clostridium beijerinckii]